MNTLQIDNIMRADCELSTTFEGVFASDRLPALSEQKTAMVMNLDPFKMDGSHWVCIYIENVNGNYFDSYGLSPSVDNFVHFLKRNCKTWTFNKTELQSYDTEVCGHYCIWFLTERARGKTMHEIVSQFSEDRAKNDLLVENQVTTRFGTIVSNFMEGQCGQCCKKRKR